MDDRPAVKTRLPGAARFTPQHQAARGRDVPRVEHAALLLPGIFRGNTVQPIQDLISPRHRDLGRTAVACSIGPACAGRSTSDFSYDGDQVGFTNPEFTGHRMVGVAY